MIHFGTHFLPSNKISRYSDIRSMQFLSNFEEFDLDVGFFSFEIHKIEKLFAIIELFFKFTPYTKANSYYVCFASTT